MAYGNKKKEKQLTPEQAVELAKQELFKYWQNSSPLFAAVKHGERTTVHPLDPNFLSKTWFLVFIDPNTILGELVILYVNEWNRRYAGFGLGFILVFDPNYGFMKEREVIERYVDRLQVSYPVTIDADGLIRKGFSAETLPKILMIENKRFTFDHSGAGWLTSVEPKIHRYLRDKDPGLPLWPFYDPSENVKGPDGPMTDAAALEMGKGRGVNFRKVPEAAAKTEPGFLRNPDEILAYGEWQQDADMIATSDSSARLVLSTRHPTFSLISASQTKLAEFAKVIVELNDSPVVEAFAGPDLKYDENGQAYVEVREGRMYHVLRNLSETRGKIALSFPTAKQVPIRVFGMRFGKAYTPPEPLQMLT